MNKLPLLSICLLFLYYNGFTQELKKVSKSVELNSKEIFYVLKSDSKIKQGKYALIQKTDTIQSGYYLNNEKSGIWRYYRKNNVEFIYDYDNKKIITDILGSKRDALYSEGYDYFEYIRDKTTKYPQEAIDAEGFNKVVVSFTVNIDGSVSDFVISIGCGNKALNNEALRVIRETAIMNTWYPAINEKGEKINSTITKQVVFLMQ
jgi:TonB family protein